MRPIGEPWLLPCQALELGKKCRNREMTSEELIAASLGS
jgi:hypothetical protein